MPQHNHLDLGCVQVQPLGDVDGGLGDGVRVPLSHLLNVHPALRGGNQHRTLHIHNQTWFLFTVTFNKQLPVGTVLNFSSNCIKYDTIPKLVNFSRKVI